MPLLNNPRDNPAGGAGWFVNPFGGDAFPEMPPPLAPGLLPEVDIRQFQVCSAAFVAAFLFSGCSTFSHAGSPSRAVH